MKRPGWQILLASTLAVIVLYWIVGAGVGKSLVRGQMHEHLAGTSEQSLALDYLRFNPFTMTARFEGLRLSEVNTAPALTVAAGHLRLAFSSFFGGTFTVSELFLQQPSVHVAVSGTIGDRRLRSLGSLQLSADKNKKPRPMHIAHAMVEGGHVTVSESAGWGTRSPLMRTHISGVKFELSDWRSEATTPALFDLSARINDSGTLHAEGVWVPAGHTVEADVELNGLVLTPFATLFNAWLADAELAGVLGAHGKFRHHADGNSFEGALDVRQLTVDDTSGQSVFSAGKLTARGVKTGNGRSPASVQWVDMERPGFNLHLDENGQLNVQRLIVEINTRIDKATVRDGRVSFTDARLPSVVQIDLDKIAGEMTRHVDSLQETLAINLTSDASRPWAVTISGVIDREGEQVRAEGDATLKGFEVGILSTYFSRLTAREIKAGLLGFDVHYRVEGPEMMITSKVALSDLDLGVEVEKAPASDIPLDLAIALLTDKKHLLAFELPVNILTINSGDAWSQAFNESLTGLVNATTAESRNIMARLANLNPDEVSRIVFADGSTEIMPTAEVKLAALVSALAQRPLLGVQVQGHYAARADRAALARRQVGLHVALAASTHSNNASAKTGLDFSDPKVQAVLDEFATARLNADERKTLKEGGPQNGDETALVTQRLYYPNVFEALAAKESVSDYALRQLARYRAHSLVGRLQELGIETQRLSVDKRVAAQPDNVPASVALTVFAFKPPGN